MFFLFKCYIFYIHLCPRIFIHFKKPKKKWLIPLNLNGKSLALRKSKDMIQTVKELLVWPLATRNQTSQHQKSPSLRLWVRRTAQPTEFSSFFQFFLKIFSEPIRLENGKYDSLQIEDDEERREKPRTPRVEGRTPKSEQKKVPVSPKAKKEEPINLLKANIESKSKKPTKNQLSPSKSVKTELESALSRVIQDSFHLTNGQFLDLMIMLLLFFYIII